MADLATLQKTIGVDFIDASLLERSLVHSSYVNENPHIAPTSNERLEFLGDAVLDMVITERLYHDLPSCDEGEMTKLRSDLVRRETLARLARTIHLGDFLYLGRGEKGSGGCDKPINLAGALESLIAAVFLDQGQEVVKGFILKLFREEFKNIVTKGGEANYKSQLQEIIQARVQRTPSYHVVESEGPDHDKRFTVEAKVGGTVLGRGSGKSKKAAEIEAAHQALKKLKD